VKVTEERVDVARAVLRAEVFCDAVHEVVSRATPVSGVPRARRTAWR
jgi:hypothetical protein